LAAPRLKRNDINTEAKRWHDLLGAAGIHVD
jgi:hypothetical protein